MNWKKELIESKFPLLMGSLMAVAVLALVLIRENGKSEKLQSVQTKKCETEILYWKLQYEKKDSFLVEQKKITDTIYSKLIELKTISKIIK